MAVQAIWRKSLKAPNQPMPLKFTAGGTIVKGDILAFSSGTVVGAGDAAAPTTLAGIALHEATSGAEVLVAPLMPDDLWEVTLSGTVPNVGSLLEIDVTSGEQTLVADSATGKQVARLLEVVHATTKRCLVRFIGAV